MNSANEIFLLSYGSLRVHLTSEQLEWASFLTVDKTGEICIHQTLPKLKDGLWVISGKVEAVGKSPQQNGVPSRVCLDTRSGKPAVKFCNQFWFRKSFSDINRLFDECLIDGNIDELSVFVHKAMNTIFVECGCVEDKNAYLGFYLEQNQYLPNKLYLMHSAMPYEKMSYKITFEKDEDNPLLSYIVFSSIGGGEYAVFVMESDELNPIIHTCRKAVCFLKGETKTFELPNSQTASRKLKNWVAVMRGYIEKLEKLPL